VPVRGRHQHLAKTPWSVAGRLADDHAAFDKSPVQGVDVVDFEIDGIA